MVRPALRLAVASAGGALTLLVGPAVSLAADTAAKQPVALDPARRTYLVMALFALALIGTALVIFVAWTGRMVRRTAKRRFPPTPLHTDDWYRKPLVPQPDDPPAESSS